MEKFNIIAKNSRSLDLTQENLQMLVNIEVLNIHMGDTKEVKLLKLQRAYNVAYALYFTRTNNAASETRYIEKYFSELCDTYGFSFSEDLLY